MDFFQILFLLVGVYAVIGIGVFKIGFDNPSIQFISRFLGDTAARVIYMLIGIGLILIVTLGII